MPATVTLATTTLAAPVSMDDQYINLVSISGVLIGSNLCVLDGGGPAELMDVLGFGTGNLVKVIRGVDGTRTSAHSPASTVYIGTADQFYSRNPHGEPPDAVLVSPYINVRTGGVWFAQGDTVPVSGTQTVGPRWWQLQANTYDVGAVGVRTTSQNPTSST